VLVILGMSLALLAAAPTCLLARGKQGVHKLGRAVTARENPSGDTAGIRAVPVQPDTRSEVSGIGFRETCVRTRHARLRTGQAFLDTGGDGLRIEAAEFSKGSRPPSSARWLSNICKVFVTRYSDQSLAVSPAEPVIRQRSCANAHIASRKAKKRGIRLLAAFSKWLRWIAATAGICDEIRQ
jgi:hypothetical protein